MPATTAAKGAWRLLVRVYASGTRIHTLGTAKMEIYLRGAKMDHKVWVAKGALPPASKPLFVITRIQVSFTWEDLKLTRTVAARKLSVVKELYDMTECCK